MKRGTGTKTALVVAEIEKELNILAISIIIKPFIFEGKTYEFSEQGVNDLSKYVDSLVTIPNDKLLKVLNKGVSLLDTFSTANNILKRAVQGIAELITWPELIDIDLADIRTVISEMGHITMIGTGISLEEDGAKEATKIAISSPLLEDIDLSK